MNKLLPVALLAGFGLLIVSQLGRFKKGFRQKISSVKLNLNETRRMAFTRIVLDIKINIENQSKLQATLKGGNLDFIFKDKIVGSIDRIGEVYVNAGAITVIPIKVSLDTLSVIGSVGSLIKLIGSGIKQSLTVRGELVTTLGVLAVNEKIDFNI